MPQISASTGMISPDAGIEIDGTMQAELSAALLSIIVEETTAGLYRCEARFGNWEGDGEKNYPYLNRQLLDFGTEIQVTMGTDEGEGTVFSGRISGIEAQYSATDPASITILAEDRLMDLRMSRRTRVFEEMSDGDMFEQIARDHSLKAEIDIVDNGPATIAQINQSDLAFIRDRARRNDAEVWVKDGTLHVQERSRRTLSSDEYILVLGVGLLEFEVLADLAHQYSGVVVSGWDVQAKEGLSYTATDACLGSELNGFQSGSAILKSAFGERNERIARHIPFSTIEAQAAAEAIFRQHARQFVVGHGRAWGDARLRVGRQVTLEGLGDLFSGPYTVTEVQHVFTRQTDGGGYVAEFTVERPGIEST